LFIFVWRSCRRWGLGRSRPRRALGFARNGQRPTLDVAGREKSVCCFVVSSAAICFVLPARDRIVIFPATKKRGEQRETGGENECLGSRRDLREGQEIMEMETRPPGAASPDPHMFTSPLEVRSSTAFHVINPPSKRRSLLASSSAALHCHHVVSLLGGTQFHLIATYQRQHSILGVQIPNTHIMRQGLRLHLVHPEVPWIIQNFMLH
jgi:hypothetical protein